MTILFYLAQLLRSFKHSDSFIVTLTAQTDCCWFRGDKQQFLRPLQLSTVCLTETVS